jgi:hypothetical protein
MYEACSCEGVSDAGGKNKSVQESEEVRVGRMKDEHHQGSSPHEEPRCIRACGLFPSERRHQARCHTTCHTKFTQVGRDRHSKDHCKDHYKQQHKDPLCSHVRFIVSFSFRIIHPSHADKLLLPSDCLGCFANVHKVNPSLEDIDRLVNLRLIRCSGKNARH